MTATRHADAGRRAFLLRACALGAAGAAAPLAANLAALGAAAAHEAPAGSYKALVCVFLYGGNDPYNTIVPYDEASHRAYAAARATSRCRASRCTPPSWATGRRPTACASRWPVAGAAGALYARGRMAVALNVGPLVAPTSKADYVAGKAALPPKLFSHNDQQSYWQALAPEGASSGWAGRLTDLLLAGSATSGMAGVTAGGNTVLLAGRHSSGYRVGPQGSTAIDLLRHGLYGSEACTALLRDLIAAPRPHLMESELAAIALRSIATDARLRDALATVPPPPSFAGVDTPLAGQLRIVARIIAARQPLGARRQVFFVSQNGYDNHTGLRDDHPALLRELGQALAAFQAELDRMGMADQVTTFTASEFGRTLGSNGNGSDHGWGGHHLVLGGAVRGGRCYGAHPDIALDGPGFVDNGRLLPDMAVEQLGAELGAWFGAGRDELALAFPNLSRFGPGPEGLLPAPDRAA